MPLPKPFPGLVVHYSYLWDDEHRRGQEEGVKHRPCVIVHVVSQDAAPLVWVAPVTHSQPRSAHAVELPLPTKRRLGLDERPSWVIVNEVNRFRWPGLDLRQIPGKPAGTFSYGPLPPALFRQIRDKLVALAGQRGLAATPR